MPEQGIWMATISCTREFGAKGLDGVQAAGVLVPDAAAVTSTLELGPLGEEVRVARHGATLLVTSLGRLPRRRECREWQGWW
jgi:hypothetical protein